MRKMKELLKTNEDVWFQLPKDETVRGQFLKELEEMGCTFANGEKVTADKIGMRMAVHRDGTVAYVSMFVWAAAFDVAKSRFSHIPKIDYEKYISGKKYVIAHSDFIAPEFKGRLEL